MKNSISSILSGQAIARLVVGWGAFIALLVVGRFLEPPVPTPWLVLSLALIIGVILYCAFGVVHEAEALAHRLGDPYGSLVLTLSIVIIEVVLIAAVMLGPGEHATIARDSVMAVSMIIMNLVIGLSLLLGGTRHGDLAPNRTGVSAYLALLVVLSSVAFALPALIGHEGSYTAGQEIPIIVLTLGLYAYFLYRQMGAQADDFRELDQSTIAALVTPAGANGASARLPVAGVAAVSGAAAAGGTASSADPASSGTTDETPGGGSEGDERTSLSETFREHGGEIIARLVLLVATVLPIVLLSHDMASLLDDGLGRLGAPTALAGVLIAMIVFLPESITSIRAALGGEIQRVSNLCHGALVSTVGLTIPAVLVIGLLTNQTVVFAESPANLLLIGVTLLLSVATFAAPRVSAMHGAAHLVVFAVYGIVLFS